MKSAPEKIYLQLCDEIDCELPFEAHVEVTWCQDKINESDIEYLRADTVPQDRVWKSITSAQMKALWVAAEKKPSVFAGMVDAKLKELNG